MRDHRVSLKKFQGTKDIQKIFFDHRRIKLEMNNGKIRRKSPTLNNTGIEKEITVVVMRYFELNNNKNAAYQNLRNAISDQREMYSLSECIRRGKINDLSLLFRK